MSERFRKGVGTVDISCLEIWIVHGTRINLDIHGGGDRIALSVQNARELRDWLTRALPCEHPRGYSVTVKFNDGTEKWMCGECHEVSN